MTTASACGSWIRQNIRVAFMPSDRAARRIDSGSQYAASSATTRVSSLTSLVAPPMMPASASALSGPATTPCRGDEELKNAGEGLRVHPYHLTHRLIAPYKIRFL